MPQQMPLGVLRSCGAEPGADTPVGRRAEFDRPIFDRHSAQQHEAAAVDHLAAQALQRGAERWKRKVVATYGRDIEAACQHGVGRRLNLGNLRGGQAVGPVRLAQPHLGTGPGGWALDQLRLQGGRCSHHGHG